MFAANEKLCIWNLHLYSIANFFSHIDLGALCSERFNTNTEEFYSNKLILAPMVRMNSLPFRLLALDYGADIVYSEEIVDERLIRSERKYNEILNTVDFVDSVNGGLIFQTCSREKNKIILQMGSSEPERAARAAALVAKDVAGIDINMGCPKDFSVLSGMGAALLCNPLIAGKIIESVSKAVDVPVSCKIRVRRNVEETISFCERMVESGAKAITVHGRTVDQRPNDSNQITVIHNVSASLSVPVIANGESGNIRTYEDVLAFKRRSGCSSVMIARAAQKDPSIFRKEGKLPREDVIRGFLIYAIRYNNYLFNTRYCVQKMLGSQISTPRGHSFIKTRNLQQICTLWNMEDYCREKMDEYRTKGLKVQYDVMLGRDKEKQLNAATDHVYLLPYKFERANFINNTDLPKDVLRRFAQKYPIPLPKYDTWEESRSFFRSMVNFNGTKYTSTHREKSKQSAEHGAAAVCLSYVTR